MNTFGRITKRGRFLNIKGMLDIRSRVIDIKESIIWETLIYIKISGNPDSSLRSYLIDSVRISSTDWYK